MMGQLESSYTKLGAAHQPKKVLKVENDETDDSKEREAKRETLKIEKRKDKRERKESLFHSIPWRRGRIQSIADDPSAWPAWYHGWCRRVEVEQKLKDGPQGLFIVKNSTEFPGDLTLCLVCRGEVLYYRVRREGAEYTIDRKELFKDVGTMLAMLSLC